MLTTPPRVITTKDLQYLKDAMSWELSAMKKIHHFAQECQDPQIRQELDRIGRIHQTHYQTLLNHCQTNNTAAMSQVQPAFAQQANPQQGNPQV